VRSALQALEGERMVVIHRHKQQRLVVREGVAGPGVHAPGPALALTKTGWGRGGGVMSACSFRRLLQLVNKQLDLDGQLRVYDHLDRCDICRDAVYQLACDRDEALFIYRPPRVKPFVVPYPVDAAG